MHIGGSCQPRILIIEWLFFTLWFGIPIPHLPSGDQYATRIPQEFQTIRPQPPIKHWGTFLAFHAEAPPTPSAFHITSSLSKGQSLINHVQYYVPIIPLIELDEINWLINHQRNAIHDYDWEIGAFQSCSIPLIPWMSRDQVLPGDIRKKTIASWTSCSNDNLHSCIIWAFASL